MVNEFAVWQGDFDEGTGTKCNRLICWRRWLQTLQRRPLPRLSPRPIQIPPLAGKRVVYLRQHPRQSPHRRLVTPCVSDFRSRPNCPSVQNETRFEQNAPDTSRPGLSSTLASLPTSAVEERMVPSKGATQAGGCATLRAGLIDFPVQPINSSAQLIEPVPLRPIMLISLFSTACSRCERISSRSSTCFWVAVPFWRSWRMR